MNGLHHSGSVRIEFRQGSKAVASFVTSQHAKFIALNGTAASTRTVEQLAGIPGPVVVIDNQVSFRHRDLVVSIVGVIENAPSADVGRSLALTIERGLTAAGR